MTSTICIPHLQVMSSFTTRINANEWSMEVTMCSFDANQNTHQKRSLNVIYFKGLLSYVDRSFRSKLMPSLHNVNKRIALLKKAYLVPQEMAMQNEIHFAYYYPCYSQQVQATLLRCSDRYNVAHTDLLYLLVVVLKSASFSLNAVLQNATIAAAFFCYTYGIRTKEQEQGNFFCSKRQWTYLLQCFAHNTGSFTLNH